MNPKPTYSLRLGDSLEVLKTLPDNSIDSVVTDPPYGLGKQPDAMAMLADWVSQGHHDVKGKGFMGKSWDAFVPQPALWKEVFRVLKPGGHILSFAGTRTYDLMTLSLRIAGFEIRDCVMWVYGSGFPKSLDVSKAIDKAAGAEREVVGTKLGQPGYSLATHKGREVYAGDWTDPSAECAITAPSTPEAQQWSGWGTALKPAVEPCVLARKPLAGTVAANVLQHGTGALNVDGCRVQAAESLVRPPITVSENRVLGKGLGVGTQDEPAGRWPANLILTYPENEYKLKDNITPQQLSKLAEWMNENS